MMGSEEERRWSVKTADDIKNAREIVNEARMNPDISADQNLVLTGMSVALCWVAGSPFGSTLERLIQGERVATKKGGAS